MSLFNALVKEIETGKSNINGLSYKTKVICLLNKAPGFTASKVDLCIGLSEENPDKPHPYFMTRPTVFTVLIKHGLIKKAGDGYALAGNLTPEQSKIIMTMCGKKLKGLRN